MVLIHCCPAPFINEHKVGITTVVVRRKLHSVQMEDKKPSEVFPLPPYTPFSFLSSLFMCTTHSQPFVSFRG